MAHSGSIYRTVLVALLICFSSVGQAHAASLKTFGGGVFQSGDSGTALTDFRNSGNVSLLRQLNTNFSDGSSSFADFTCAAEIKASTKPIEVALVYDVHGSNTLLDAAKKRVFSRAIAGDSFLLLESDTNQNPASILRELNKYDYSEKSVPENIRGMDTNMLARNIWFMNDYQISLKEGRRDQLRHLTEELIANPRLEEKLRDQLNDPQILPSEKRLLERLLSKVDRYKLYGSPAGADLDDLGTSYLPERNVATLETIVERVLKSELTEFKKEQAVNVEKASAIRRQQELAQFAQKKAQCEATGITPSERDLLGCNQLSQVSLPAFLSDDAYVAQAGFNARDIAFNDSIGTAICDAFRAGKTEVIVRVGAGHADNLLKRVEASLRAAGLPERRVQVSSFPLEAYFIQSQRSNGNWRAAVNAFEQGNSALLEKFSSDQGTSPAPAVGGVTAGE